MEKHRQIKMLSIIALVIAIVGMSLGFAAFSTTLSISSSASVTPSSDDFKVVFSSSSTGIETDMIYPSNDEVLAAPAKVNGTSLSDIHVTLTEPGQVVFYQFYIYNAGEYDVYIDSVNFGEKVCTAGDGTSDALVQAACDDIFLTLVGPPSNAGVIDSSFVFEEYKLTPGESHSIELGVNYLGDNIADGPFDVSFGDVTFDVSTAKRPEISFSIYDEYEDKTYSFKAVSGMTWSDWIESSYNDFCGFNDNYVGCGFGGYLGDETISNQVENGKEYVCEYDF